MGITRTLLGLMMCAVASKAEVSDLSSETRETVVVLHGMGRTCLSMRKLAVALEREGYRVINLNYPSTRRSVDGCVEFLAQTIRARRLDHETKLHFVTHSLGGIVVRAYLQRDPRPNLGRVVMLSPPNQGSELADKMMSGGLRRLYRWTTGPAGQELGTAPGSTANRLGPVDFPLGIIAGTRRIASVFSRVFPGPNDGKVAVERAKVAGMTDFLAVPHSHSFIMRSSKVCRETIQFLKHGRFSTAPA